MGADAGHEHALGKVVLTSHRGSGAIGGAAHPAPDPDAEGDKRARDGPTRFSPLRTAREDRRLTGSRWPRVPAFTRQILQVGSAGELIGILFRDPGTPGLATHGQDQRKDVSFFNLYMTMSASENARLYCPSCPTNRVPMSDSDWESDNVSYCSLSDYRLKSDSSDSSDHFSSD